MKALLAGLLHVASTQIGPDPSFPKPTIERVRIVGDTVWFEGTRGFDSVAVRYCFVRRSGNWCRLPQARSEVMVDEPMPRSPRDSIALAPGLGIVCRPGDNWPSSCEAFGVLSSAERRVHWLIPQATRATRDALQRAIGLETDELPEMSTFMTARAIGDGAIWFGLGGGFPEGEGAFGGLVRFDRERRTIETITHPKLANATVTSLAIDGDALWIGTIHPGEYAPWGSTGILRRDLRSGRWAQLDSATTDLPDNLIQAIAVAEGTLYVATGDGLCAFDTRSNRWSVRYFRRAIIADSIVYALATARPADEASDEAMFVLMRELEVSRRAAFISAMRQAGVERLRRVLVPTDDTFAEALGHPALTPFLVEALANPRTSALAASALGRIEDRQAIRPMQQALARAADISAGATIAAALARLGDPGGLEWLHLRLQQSSPTHVRRAVLSALRGVRDTASIGPLLSLAARGDTPDDVRRAAVEALQAYESPRVWRRVVDTAAHVASLRPAVVAVADSIALSDTSVEKAVGDWAIELVDRGGRQDGYGAIKRAARLRPHQAVRSLVQTVITSETWGPLAAQELVRLTGVDSAPAIDPWSADGRRAAQEFWSAWWSANGSRYTVVTPDVGRRAYDAWFERIIRQRELERERRRNARRAG